MYIGQIMELLAVLNDYEHDSFYRLLPGDHIGRVQLEELNTARAEIKRAYEEVPELKGKMLSAVDDYDCLYYLLGQYAERAGRERNTHEKRHRLT